MRWLVIYLLLVTNILAWDFTQDDYDNLTDNQKQVIKDSYYIGLPYDLGYTLAALAIVETKAGAVLGDTTNKICGYHQVNVYIALKYSKSKGSSKVLCEYLNVNSKLSSIMALDNLLYWKSTTKIFNKMIKRYNRGWVPSDHDAEYIRRFDLVLKLLLKNKLKGIL